MHFQRQSDALLKEIDFKETTVDPNIWEEFHQHLTKMGVSEAIPNVHLIPLPTSGRYTFFMFFTLDWAIHPSPPFLNGSVVLTFLGNTFELRKIDISLLESSTVIT